MTQIDHSELKYSLRSVEMFLDEPDEVIVIGEHLPEWITNVTHIKLPDMVGQKQLSIRRKILIALEYCKEFLFMNDDVYFLQKTIEFPYYWHGFLKKYNEPGTRQVETKLTQLNKPLKLFDGHYPLIYDQQFKEVSTHFNSDCIIKSMYCNFLELEGVFVPDCKIQHSLKINEINEFTKNKTCLSTGLIGLQNALLFLKNLFPNKSKYEQSIL